MKDRPIEEVEKELKSAEENLNKIEKEYTDLTAAYNKAANARRELKLELEFLKEKKIGFNVDDCFIKADCEQYHYDIFNCYRIVQVGITKVKLIRYQYRSDDGDCSFIKTTHSMSKSVLLTSITDENYVKIELAELKKKIDAALESTN